MESFTVIIDGKECEAYPGESILQVAERNGIVIPVFCYHKELRPEGACRVCLVEVEGAPRLVTACTLKAMPNMVVKTNTPKVRKARGNIIRMILNNHALECKNCDKSGECELQMTGFRYASKDLKYKEEVRKKGVLIEGKLIAINTDRCILCRRCIRMCGENMGNRVLGIIGRGYRAFISPFAGDFEKGGCEHCGSCVDVCPVGALLDRAFKHDGRPWKLEKIWTTCSYCGSKCYMEVDTLNGEIKRVVGRIGVNHAHNRGYLCVAGKWGWDVAFSPYRFESPLIREGDTFKEISFDEALSIVESKANMGNFGLFVDGSFTCEELDLIFDKFQTKDVAGSEFNYLRFLNALEEKGVSLTSLDEALKEEVVVVVGDFLEETSPVIGTLLRLKVVQERKRVVRVGNFPSKLDRSAYKVFVGDILETLGSPSFKKVLRGKKVSFIVGTTVYDSLNGVETAKIMGEFFFQFPVYPIPPLPNSYYLKEKGVFSYKNSSPTVFYFTSSNERFYLSRGDGYKVLFTPFFDKFAKGADLVIPIETFFEKSGKFCDLGSKDFLLEKAVDPSFSLKSFLSNLSSYSSKSLPIEDFPQKPLSPRKGANIFVVLSKKLLAGYSSNVASLNRENRLIWNGKDGFEDLRKLLNFSVYKAEGLKGSALLVEEFSEGILKKLKECYPYREFLI